ncbi:hypothetical protein ON010_g13744 [Phytophthora cinnamomi]|nr:hypothetical protein ON010_g13744 [Phytophthora cinnamomi]
MITWRANRKVDANQYSQVRDVVKVTNMAAKLVRQAPDNYGSHSFRSGDVTAVFKARFEDVSSVDIGRSEALHANQRANSIARTPVVLPKPTL